MPKFKVGDWVVDHRLGLGKIIAINRPPDRANLRLARYDVQFTIGEFDIVDEIRLRKATQDEINAAQKKPEPRFKVRDWVVQSSRNRVGRIGSVFWNSTHNCYGYFVEFTDETSAEVTEPTLRKATQDEIDAALSKRAKQEKPQDKSAGFTILRMARYINPAENSNKVYGIVERDGKSYTFWGGYHKALAVKPHLDQSDAEKQYHSKIVKGYKETDWRPHRDWLTEALEETFAKSSRR